MSLDVTSSCARECVTGLCQSASSLRKSTSPYTPSLRHLYTPEQRLSSTPTFVTVKHQFNNKECSFKLKFPIFLLNFQLRTIEKANSLMLWFYVSFKVGETQNLMVHIGSPSGNSTQSENQVQNCVKKYLGRQRTSLFSLFALTLIFSERSTSRKWNRIVFFSISKQLLFCAVKYISF